MPATLGVDNVQLAIASHKRPHFGTLHVVASWGPSPCSVTYYSFAVLPCAPPATLQNWTHHAAHVNGRSIANTHGYNGYNYNQWKDIHVRAHCPRLCDRCPLRPAPSRLRALSSAHLLTHASLVPCSCVRRVLERRVVVVPEQRSQNNWLFRADRNHWFSTRAWAGCNHHATYVSLQLLVPVGSSECLHRIARRAESVKAALGLTYQLHLFFVLCSCNLLHGTQSYGSHSRIEYSYEGLIA